MKTLVLAIGALLACVQMRAQLVVDFTTPVRQACGSLQASFTNLSTFNGTPINCSNQYTYQWNFGATICQPSRIYNTPGTYQVCLTMRPASGGTAITTCKDSFITVWALPMVAFQADVREGCAPMTVNFTDQSTSANGAIVNRLWDIGGSNPVSSNATATSTYTLPASYSAKIIVTDDKGCTNFLNVPNYIKANAVPVADFSANKTFTCTPPLSVNFTNGSTATGPNMTYRWTFQGAANFQSFTGPTPPPVVWSQLGNYTVRLVTTDNATGCADTLVRQNFISVGNQVRFDADRDVCVGETVTFTDRSSGSPTAWLWNFGTGDPADTSTLRNPTFVYDAPGCYPITLTTTVSGCTNTFTSPLCVNVHALPQGSISINNDRGCELPHTSTFTGFGAGSISSWRWRIHEGSNTTTRNTQSTSYTFNEFGDHLVELTITDANGCQSTFQDTVHVRPLEASIPAGQIMGCIPLVTTLSDNSNSVVPITQWEWVVNDVHYFEENPTINLTMPADTGIYDVKLIITNELGCVDSVTIENKIAAGLEPEVDFDATPREGCIENAIHFTDLSSTYGDFWFWEFGDGGTSQEQHPVYEYQDTGHFEVCLTVFHNGCQVRECKPDFIYIVEPRAGFEEARLCEDPYTVVLTESTIGADTLVYFFGTNEVKVDTLLNSMGMDSIVIDTIFVPFDSIPGVWNPVFTFPDTGRYVIRQWVKSFVTLCEHSAGGEVYITDPVALFFIDSLQGCAPFTITPRNESVFDEAWLWSGPPGVEFSDTLAETPQITFNQAGKYTGISLTITDINGCTDTYVFPDTITVNEIYPGFTYFPSTGCTPLPVSFQDTSSNLFGNNIAWTWDFGDGSAQESGQNVEHTYTLPDTLDISLFIVDDFGCMDTLVRQQIVTPTFPFVSFDYDTLACTGQTVHFNSTTEGVGLSYIWDFGTGNPLDTSHQKSPTFEYGIERTYEVCLLAVDINGCADRTCHNVRVANPVAEFAFAPAYASCPPLIDTFTNLSINADPNGYIWSFGDSDSSSLVSPLHIYTEPGVYTVALTATSYSGCTHTIVKDSIIRVDGPRGDFEVAPLNGCRPHSINVQTHSEQPAYHFVDYDDGMVDSSKALVTEFVFSHTYNYTGGYLPRLTLEDEGGCRRSFTADSIHVEGIDIDFLASDTLVCEGTNIQFSNFSTSTRQITYFEWFFPGGTPATSTDWEPTVTYADAGQYDVILRIYNTLCQDSLTVPSLITVESYPQAAFTPLPAKGCEPLGVLPLESSSIPNGTIGAWRWDFGDGATDDRRQPPAHVFNYDANNSSSDSTIYTIKLVVASQLLTCKDSVEHDIAVSPSPLLPPIEDKTICWEESVILDANLATPSNGVTYEWTPSTGLDCTDCLNPVAEPLATTDYRLIATNASNCTDTLNVRVNVIPHPIPHIDLIDSISVCEQSVSVLQASVPNTPVISYTWRDTTASGNTLSCLNCSNPFASPATTTTYFLNVVGQGGCPAADSITVEVIEETVDMGLLDRGLCLGDTVILHSPLGTNPRWRPSNGLNCTFCANPVASPSNTTTYYLTTDYQGCPITDSVVVTVIRPLDVSAGDDKGVCLGESTQLEAYGLGSVSWSPITYLNNSNIYTPSVIQPQQNITYTMTVMFDKCVMTDEVEVRVRTAAEVEATAEAVCLGEPAQLNATGVADAYVWSPSTGLSNPNIANPVATVSKNTTYTVTASLQNCADATATATVVVYVPPQLSFLEIQNFFLGQSLTMQVGVEGGSGDYDYEWSPSKGLSCTGCPSPQVQPDTSITYHVLVTDRLTGCSTEGTIELRQGTQCSGDLVQVPNGFTPNGDGENDVLYVRGTSLSEISVFRVFNRWGEVVFETNDIYEGWDGKHTGSYVNPGVYVYYVEAPCALDGSKLFKKGNVTVIR
jgi:gliding motility-associated-like protein